MPINSSDFLSAAENIFNSAKNEADYRNAISRAYYAVYHHAKKYADDAKYAEVDGSSHRALATRFQENRPSDSIGRTLKRLHQARCIADYELRKTITQKKAEEHITECKNLIAEII